MNFPAPEWHLSIGSTNTHLLRKFESTDRLPDGYAVAAQHQTEGKGQRSKRWTDTAGKSLLLSVGAHPAADLSQQPLFCFGVAVTIAEFLERTFAVQGLAIKWPNDLYVNSQKLGGILIENILRGGQWQVTVIGLGLNLYKQPFEESLSSKPTYLAAHTRAEIQPPVLARQIQKVLTDFAVAPLPVDIMSRYNQRLYRRGELKTFETGGVRWAGVVEAALPDGRLMVQVEDHHKICTHGVDIWIPGATIH